MGRRRTGSARIPCGSSQARFAVPKSPPEGSQAWRTPGATPGLQLRARRGPRPTYGTRSAGRTCGGSGSLRDGSLAGELRGRRPDGETEVGGRGRGDRRGAIDPALNLDGVETVVPDDDASAALQASAELRLMVVDVFAVPRQPGDDDRTMAVLERLEDAARAPMDDGETSHREVLVQPLPGQVPVPVGDHVRDRGRLTALDDEALPRQAEAVGETHGALERLDVGTEDERDHSSAPA